MRRLVQATLVILLLGQGMVLAAAPDETKVGAGKEEQFHSDVPAYDVNVILGYPTEHSVVASVFVERPMSVGIRYGPTGEQQHSVAAKKIDAGDTREFVLDGLPADTEISYELFDANSGELIESPFSRGAFHTARPQGKDFVFTIQADSHLDRDTIPSLYEQTLQNIADAKPDFHIDLGDTFMADKIVDLEQAEKQYLAQRYYFGRLGHSVPLFMVLGNHDGITASKSGRRNRAELTDWSVQKRAAYFPTLKDDRSYRRNAEAGRYHYSWHWGDALFVVLDPYSQSGNTRSGRDPWNMTLGRAQYEWLAEILRNSDAEFKFVFIHQLVSGIGNGGRGGAEAAPLYEWGGHDEAGEWDFEEFRPGWDQPVHSLLRETGVSAVFHGHDHFFAHQLLDGISYTLVPQPSHRNSRNHHAEEYGYHSGTFVPNSGHVQVEVSEDKAVISYVRSANEDLKRPRFENGDVAYEYVIVPASSSAPRSTYR